jgi:predicted nucleic acid-binding protein
VEATNALLKKVRRRELTAAGARQAIEAFPRYLQLSPTEDVFEHGLEVALEFGCTFFDGLYVALAFQEGCPLVTGDTRLIRSLPRSFAGRIVWLGDLKREV